MVIQVGYSVRLAVKELDLGEQLSVELGVGLQELGVLGGEDGCHDLRLDLDHPVLCHHALQGECLLLVNLELLGIEGVTDEELVDVEVRIEYGRIHGFGQKSTAMPLKSRQLLPISYVYRQRRHEHIKVLFQQIST